MWFTTRQSGSNTSLILKAASSCLLLGLFAGFGPFSCVKDNVFTEIQNLDVGYDVTAIFCASDGTSYWNADVDKIAKRTSDGTITVYTDSATITNALSGIGAEDGDGNLWMASTEDNELVKMTPAGVFTHYAATTPASGIASVCLGPDGNIWFTQLSVGQIAKMTTTGTVTEYAITAGQQAYGMMSDGGLLWVSAVDGSFHVHIKSYNTSGVQQSTADTNSTYILPGRIFPGQTGEYWIWNLITNERVLRVRADGTVLSQQLPHFTVNFADQPGLIRVNDGFIMTGILVGPSGEGADVAKISLGNNLLAFEKVAPVADRQLHQSCLNPIDELIYVRSTDVIDGAGTPRLLIIDDITNMTLIESDQLPFQRRD